MRQDITGFVVLLAFFALAAFLLTSTSQEGPISVSLEIQPDPSVENTRASGSHGLFEWTRSLGFKPDIWRQDFLDLPDDASTMICIAPNSIPSEENVLVSSVKSESESTFKPKQHLLTRAEGRAVKSWLEQGHTMILMASSLPTAAEVQAAKPPGDDDDGDAAQTFASVLGMDVQSALHGSPRRDFAPMQPGIWTTGVAAIRTHPGFRLRGDLGVGTVLIGDYWNRPGRLVDGVRQASVPMVQPVVAVYPYGKGRLVAIADDYFACNANLDRADNAVFLYNILKQSASPGAKILFDEYHRETGVESSNLWQALGRPLQYATLQIILVALICLAVLAPRFGRVVPIQGRDVRTSAEYITSLAGLYQTAGATTTALETVYRQFLREVCLRYGMLPTVTLDTLAEVASRRAHVNRADLKKVLIACERALESRFVSGRDLITLVRAIERFRKEMGIV